MVPMDRIELSTSPLPRECSTPELHGHTVGIYLSGAGEGNRTLTVSLEGFCSTIELHPHTHLKKLQVRLEFWWREKDSNLRSFRNRFTVCPLWPLGNPSKRERHDNVHLPLRQVYSAFFFALNSN